MRQSLLARLWLNLRDYRFFVLALLTILVCIVYGLFVNQIAVLKTIANDPTVGRIPDAEWTGYKSGWLHNYVAKLTPAGRIHYTRSILLIDCFFPLTYGSWFCVALSIAYSRLEKEVYESNRFVLLLPLFTVMFDYFENYMIFLILNNYSNGFSEVNANIASICTRLKFFMLLVSSIGIAVGIVKSLIADKKTNLPLTGLRAPSEHDY